MEEQTFVSTMLDWVIMQHCCLAVVQCGRRCLRYQFSLARPDRCFFYGAFIAYSISAHRKNRAWSRSITRVILDTSERWRCWFPWLSLYRQVKCVNESTPFLGHNAFAYNFKVKEINISEQLGGVKIAGLV